MFKIFNLFVLILIILFFFNIYSYYSSDKNIKKMSLNRSNIEQILSERVQNLLILENDTNNILEFNSSFFEEIKNNEPRSFWNLLKSK